MVYGIVTIGPAGVGKTTMCHALKLKTHKRGICGESGPGGGHAACSPISMSENSCSEDAMREFGYGPNGGLIYCMEYHGTSSGSKIKFRFGEDDTLLLTAPAK